MSKSPMSQRPLLLVLLAAVALVVSSCGGLDAPAVPEPTARVASQVTDAPPPTPPPVVSAVEPTATDDPTSTPAPTTQASPTLTPTADPTVTPAPPTQAARTPVSDLPTGPAAGALAPDLSLNDLDGEEVVLSELRGKPVLLNFWATW